MRIPKPPLADQNDAMLALTASNGDMAAVEQLLRRNWTWLKAIVLATTGKHDLVDDILQDVCVKVIDKIHQLKEPERIRPWLASIARNQAVTALRQAAKQQRIAAIAAQQVASAVNKTAAERSADQIAGDLWAAIEKMPEKYRQVFLLKYVHDYSYQQIAEILDIPFTTVQIRLVRSRRMLLERLKTKLPFANNI